MTGFALPGPALDANIHALFVRDILKPAYPSAGHGQKDTGSISGHIGREIPAFLHLAELVVEIRVAPQLDEGVELLDRREMDSGPRASHHKRNVRRQRLFVLSIGAPRLFNVCGFAGCAGQSAGVYLACRILIRFAENELFSLLTQQLLFARDAKGLAKRGAVSLGQSECFPVFKNHAFHSSSSLCIVRLYYAGWMDLIPGSARKFSLWAVQCWP